MPESLFNKVKGLRLLTVKLIVEKGRPKFLYISKGRKSETAMAHKNKMQKYPPDTT